MSSRGGGGQKGGAVETGEAGILGLARALGQKDEKQQEAVEKAQEPVKKKQKVEGDGKDQTKELEEVLRKRKPDDSGRNVLRVARDASGGKKKKKKSKKDDKKEKGASISDSDSSTSSSLFHLAALPKGVDRLHRLREERPGAIANATLRRFNVLLNQSVGREQLR